MAKNKQLTFLSMSLQAAVTSVIVGFIHYWTYDEIDWLVVFGVFFVTLVLSGVLFQFVVSKYIQAKIRPIYQLIQRTKQMDADPKADLTNLDTEVKEWVVKSQAELADYKLKENYRREFIGNVSHELKTPIFNIQGYIMTLLDGALHDDNYNVKYLDRAMKSVDRMTDLVEDLEMITKLESRGIELEKSAFDIHALVKEVLEALELKAKDKSMSILLDEEQGVWVKGDKKKIRQVIENLVVNAIKYGNDGGEVNVSFTVVDKHILVEVIDDGIGIDPQNLPRVFERFYRADKGRSREQGGSGLGLSIVKHIVEAHGHSVSVRSTPGEGSVFSFTIDRLKS